MASNDDLNERIAQLGLGSAVDLEVLLARLAQAKEETARAKEEAARKDAELAKEREETARAKEEAARKNAELAQAREEKAQAKEEAARKGAELAQAREEAARKEAESNKTSLQTFWTNEQKVDLIAQSSTTHISHHEEVQFCCSDFSLISGLQSGGATEPSAFLVALHNCSIKKEDDDQLQLTQDGRMQILYCSEAEIAALVGPFMWDILKCVGLSSVSLKLEMSFPNGEKAIHRSDVWIVKTLSGLPLAVVEVKQPGEHKDKLSNPNVLGQIFDYMANLRNSFGQCEVFGIVTTLEQWRVCWFPDTQDFAASESAKPSSSIGKSIPVASTLKRELNCSKVYALEDENLKKAIGSALIKAANSQYCRAALISTSRAYVALDSKTWSWQELNKSAPLKISLPSYETKNILPLKVLRDFRGGLDGQVYLVLTRQSHLVVVKKFYNVEDRDNEFEIWKNVYECNVRKLELVQKPSLVMPFVFHCRQDAVSGNKYFSFDLSDWGNNADCLSEDIEEDNRLKEWVSKLRQHQTSVTDQSLAPKSVLNSAVEKLARNKYVHRDIEWRHVALLPRFNGDNFVKLEPLLIDVTSAVKVEDENIALAEMSQKVKELD